MNNKNYFQIIPNNHRAYIELAYYKNCAIAPFILISMCGMILNLKNIKRFFYIQ